MAITSTSAISHREAGRVFEAGGVKSFVREEGEGEVVLCIHGVPACSYLYRKVIPELAKNGYRGVAVDFPGLGLSERMEDFDYSWTGLGKWLGVATKALNLEKYHLIIHDIGGPIGMELAAAEPTRVLSLTILNTMLSSIGTFVKPLVMRPFGSPWAGPCYLSTLQTPMFKMLMNLRGVYNTSELSYDDAKAYIEFLKNEDGGRAFLQIMQSFEPTPEKEKRYLDAIDELSVPKQIIWGKYDADLSVKNFAEPLRLRLKLDEIHEVEGRHFLQEDCYKEIVALLVSMTKK